MSYTQGHFMSMYGMCEMETGIADIVNKAVTDGCLIADVRFAEQDLTSDPDAFRELLHYGHIVASEGQGHWYQLTEGAVNRIHKRYPNL